MSTPSIVFKSKTAGSEDIEKHLMACSQNFIPALNTTVDIKEYAKKIHKNAFTFEAWKAGELIGLVAVYCNNAETKTAFITSVSVFNQYMGKGISSELLKECINFVKKQSYKSINLEVNAANASAIALYKKFKFTETGKNNLNLVLALNFNN